MEHMKMIIISSVKRIGIAGLIVLSACNSQNIDNTEKEETKVTSLANPSSPNISSLPYLTSTNDQLYISWVEKDSTQTTLKYSKYQSGSWSNPEVIANGNDWFVNWADYPMISVNDKAMMANFLAKSSSGTYSYDVNLSIKNDSSWSDAFIPHNDGTPTEHGFVSMIPMPNNQFQVAWLDGRFTASENGAMTLRTALINKDGSISEEAELDNRVCDCCQTGGALTESGPVFVYRDRSEDEIRDMSIVRFLDGEWTSPHIINSDNWNIHGCPVNGPRVDAIGNNIGVAWYTGANERPKVKLIFSKDGGSTFGKVIDVDSIAPLGRVDIELIDASTAIVSWLAKGDGKAFIKSQIINDQGIKRAPIIIAETSESRGSGFPQMVRLDDEIFFAWTKLIDEKSTNIEVAKINLN